jgi:hypothetical protein
VLHVANTVPFEEVSAVLDAANGPRRQIALPGGTVSMPAFAVALSPD